MLLFKARTDAETPVVQALEARFTHYTHWRPTSDVGAHDQHWHSVAVTPCLTSLCFPPRERSGLIWQPNGAPCCPHISVPARAHVLAHVSSGWSWTTTIAKVKHGLDLDAVEVAIV
jgi:hypothetical protein